MVVQTGAKQPSMQTHILGGGRDGVALAYQEEAHGCHQELKQLDEGGVLTVNLILHTECTLSWCTALFLVP